MASSVIELRRVFLCFFRIASVGTGLLEVDAVRTLKLPLNLSTNDTKEGNMHQGPQQCNIFFSSLTITTVRIWHNCLHCSQHEFILCSGVSPTVYRKLTVGQESWPNFKLTVIFKRKLVWDMHAHCVVNPNIFVCMNFLWPLCFICLCLYHLLRF